MNEITLPTFTLSYAVEVMADFALTNGDTDCAVQTLVMLTEMNRMNIPTCVNLIRADLETLIAVG